MQPRCTTKGFYVYLKINHKLTSFFILWWEPKFCSLLSHSSISLNQTFLPLFSTSQIAAHVRLGCSVWKFIYQRHIVKTKPDWRFDNFNIGLNQPSAPKEVERQTLSLLNTWKYMKLLPYCSAMNLWFIILFLFGVERKEVLVHTGLNP